MVVCCIQLSAPPPSPTANPHPKETLRSDVTDKFNTPFELKQIHSHLVKTNSSFSILPLDRVASVCAFSSSSSQGVHNNIDYASSIFQRVSGSHHEIVLWNSCLKTLAEGDSPSDALFLFSQLRRSNILPDTFTCSFVLKASSLVPHLPIGHLVHALIHKLGFQSDLFLQNMVLHMYTRCGECGIARIFFDKMPQRDVVSWNIIITHLTKHNDILSAQVLFDQMPKRSVRSWTSMIGGYVQCGRPRDAIRIFQQMEHSDAKPNEVTLVAVLAACADMGALDLGKRVHQDYLTKFPRNVRVYNTLIDMYIKCGSLEIAREVFNGMEERTVVSWSAMIGGLAMHGQAEEALKLFSKMSRIGIRPNGITFIGLLHACSHMGLIDEGRRFFTSMTKDYGITPQIEHYGCMVDLLSRAGRLEEAYEFINNMPIKANGVVWGALLGGCKVHKNIELAEEAIKHLLVLDPLNDGYYVVLSNIYADARRWEDTAKIRKLMRDQGVKKTPGWSSISVDGNLHEFVAGDVDHPEAEEIYRKWQELLEQMKRRGYVPDTKVVLLDMEEEQKENVLYRHSEKLAVMYGLIHATPGTPIRIMKNLRVCEDCHSALKLISEIDDREIVVRDRNRFHCFKDGSCSCKDYCSALEKRFHSSSSSITPALLLKRIGESALLLKRIGSVAEENPLLFSMEISLFAEQSSEQRFGNLGVYVVLCHARDTIGVRINVNSTIKELKDLVCKKWSTLMPTCFSFAFVCDNKRSTIDTDWDLQSLASCCESKGICSIEIYIDIGVSSSIDTSGASSSSVSVSFDGECEIRKPLRSDSWGSLITGVGQKFFGGAKEFRNNLRQFSILSGFKFKLRRNERQRVIAVCAFPDCKWSIHAVKKVSCPNVFIITKMSNKHSCKKSFDTFQKPAITSELIKSLIIDDVQRRPSIKPMDLMNKFSVEYDLNVKYYFARMGKELALKELYGDYSVSYNQLRWYTDSLKAVDPNGYVSLDVDPSTRKFRGLFIAYGASISGFTFCRPVIALDGTFLKDKHKGTLLCATALNGDQGLFPLAMAVVIGETEANWSWFLEQLKMIVSPHRPLVFMSDRHIGLLVHIPRVFPTSSYGFCFWHLKRNMNSSISSKSAIHKSRKSILELFKSTSIAYTIQDFNSRIEEMQNLGGEPIRKFISEIAVEKWANAFFPAKRYGMLSSGIAESFNSWIRDERVLPITCMIDKLRTKVMEMATNRREDARKWQSRLCPEFEKKLIEKYKASRSMHVLKSTDFRFEVISTKNNVVDLQFFTCTCRQWQVECFPCAHAIAAIVSNGEEVYPYVESYFFVDSFIRSYSQGIPAISSLNMPMEIDGDSCILPPDAKVQPGRPKGKRMGTAATDKPKRKNSCSRCKCLGHNKSTCKVTL